MPKDININNNNVLTDFDIIQNDFKEIKDVIEKVYNAMLKLDENVWVAKEKEKIDQEFLTYLKKFSEKYYDYLMVRLNFAKESVEKYKELDEERSKLSDLEII